MDADAIRVKFLEKKEGVSLRKLEAEICVSASTLSRFQRGIGDFDMDNLIKIAVWCGETVFADDGAIADGNTLENVRAAISNDEKLSPEDREKLFKLFAGMYSVMSR
jgi:transcriptional regulator with XRE-family HTH domain